MVRLEVVERILRNEDSFFSRKIEDLVGFYMYFYHIAPGPDRHWSGRTKKKKVSCMVPTDLYQ